MAYENKNNSRSSSSSNINICNSENIGGSSNSISDNNGSPDDSIFGLVTSICNALALDFNGGCDADTDEVAQLRSIAYDIILSKHPIDSNEPVNGCNELVKQICTALFDKRLEYEEASNCTGVNKDETSTRLEALLRIEEMLEGKIMKPLMNLCLYMMLKLTEVESKPRRISTNRRNFDVSLPPLTKNLFVTKKHDEFELATKPKESPRQSFFLKNSIDVMKKAIVTENNNAKNICTYKFPIPMRGETSKGYMFQTPANITQLWQNARAEYLTKALKEEPATKSSPSELSLNQNKNGLDDKENLQDSSKAKRSYKILSMESDECDSTSYMRKFVSDMNASWDLLLYDARENGKEMELLSMKLADFIVNLKLLVVGIQSETFIRNEETEDFHILENICVWGIVPQEIARYVEPFLLCGKSFAKLQKLATKGQCLKSLKSHIYRSLCYAIEEYLNMFREFVIIQNDDCELPQFYLNLRSMMCQICSLESFLNSIPKDFTELPNIGVVHLNTIWKRFKRYTNSEYITLMLFLLKRMCRVYYFILQSWFVKAKLDDPFNDLFIHDVSILHGGTKFFDATPNIRASSVPLFLVGQEEQILNCGKYTMLLKTYKPDHPLFHIECPEVKVCLNPEELDELSKAWNAYSERAEVHCKFVNLQTILDERKAWKEKIEIEVAQRIEARSKAWKEEQLKVRLKKQEMINFWRQQCKDDIETKRKQRQEKILKELRLQRELKLLEETDLLRQNLKLQSRLKYLKNCSQYLKEDIYILSKIIDKDEDAAGEAEDRHEVKTVKSSIVCGYNHKPEVPSLRKTKSLNDLRDELKMIENDNKIVEVLKHKIFRATSSESILQHLFDKSEALTLTKSVDDDQDVLAVIEDIMQSENEEEECMTKPFTSDSNSNKESMSISSQNRERLMCGRLMYDSLTHDVIKTAAPAPTIKRALTDLERNKMRVMTESYATPLQGPTSSSSTDDERISTIKKALTDLERNRNRVWATEFDILAEEPPRTPDERPLTDLERNKMRVMTEIYTTPLQGPASSSSTDDLRNTGAPVSTIKRSLTDLERNRNRVWASEFDKVDEETPKTPDKKPLTDLERNKMRVMTEIYTTPLQGPASSSSTDDLRNTAAPASTIKRSLTDLERNRNRVWATEFDIIAEEPPRTPDKKPLTDLERNKMRVMTEIYTTPLQRPASSSSTDINLNSLPDTSQMSELQINRLHMHQSHLKYCKESEPKKFYYEENPQAEIPTPSLMPRNMFRKRGPESEYSIRLQERKAEHETKDHAQRNKLHLSELLEQQQPMTKRDDNLDADTPMSMTSDVSMSASLINQQSQGLDALNNNSNEFVSLKGAGKPAVLQDIKETSFDETKPESEPELYLSRDQRTMTRAEHANACISLISAPFKKAYREFRQNQLKIDKDDLQKQSLHEQYPPYMHLYKLLEDNFAYPPSTGHELQLPVGPYLGISRDKHTRCCGGAETDVSMNRKVTSVHYGDAFMIQKCLRESIMLPVKIHYRLVRNELMRLLFEDVRIYEHFQSLRNYYLLMDGEFCGIITEGIIGKLETGINPRKLFSYQSLHTLLSTAINNSTVHATNHKFWEKISFEVLEIPDKFDLSAPDALNVLILDYKIEWPLNLIITPHAMDQYKKIFKFLFKVRRINYCLDDAFQFLVKSRESKTIKSPQFRRVQMIRYKLAHFVSSLQTYLYSSVLQSSWQRFQDDLCKVQDMETLYQAHIEYLKQIKFLCMLNVSSKNIRGPLNSTLKIILRFCHVLKAEAFKLNPETNEFEHKRYDRLLYEEYQFNQFISYLLHVCQKIAFVGYQEEISDFVTLMNLNQYYSNLGTAHQAFEIQLHQQLQE